MHRRPRTTSFCSVERGSANLQEQNLEIHISDWLCSRALAFPLNVRTADATDATLGCRRAHTHTHRTTYWLRSTTTTK